MSLQQAAKHLAAQGRGGDTTLVHMNPNEVKALQAVAMAHGGSLSVNPQTGLPEAGFLSNILPMVVGAGLAAATGGTSLALTPGMIGLGVGGFETLRTGNLQKGIMSGLGAYGGAGLAGGLMGVGAEQAANTASANMTSPDAVFQKAMSGAYENPDVFLPEAQQQAQQQAAKIAAERTAAINAANASPFETMGKGLQATFQNPQGIGAGLSNLGSNLSTGFGGPGAALGTTALAAAAPMLMGQYQGMPGFKGSGPNPYQYQFNANPTTPTPTPDVPGYGDLGQNFGRERRYFNPVYTRMAGGGPVEQMSDANAVGANTGFPMADISRGAYATPYQQPISQNVLSGPQDTRVDTYTGEERLAGGGLSHLGDYSDGGRLLRGPGDGVSDSIPAVIGGKQPARLADGEFVVPARIVSELGNGSTEAGARKLYAMMDRVQAARGKTVGKGKIAKNTRADKHLPA